MPVPVFQNFDQILQQMISHVVAQTDLSDVTDASTFKHFLAAMARALEEGYYRAGLILEMFNLDTAVGEALDQRVAELTAGIIAREQAEKATGFVTFGRSGTTGAVAIAQGTLVRTADGVDFITTAAGSIADGFSTSADVPVIAVEGGTNGNVAANTVIKFANKPSGVQTVTNASAFGNGKGEEDDDSLRSRARDWERSLARCHVYALEVAARGVELTNGQRVEYSKAIEDITNRGEVTLYVDDGQGTAETFTEITSASPENVTAGLAGPPVGTAVGGEEFLFLDNKPIRPEGPTPLKLTSSTRGVLVENTDYLVNTATAQIKFTPALVAAEQIDAEYTYFTGLIQEVQKVIDGDVNDRENYPGHRAAGVRVVVDTPVVVIQQVEASLRLEDGFTLTSIEAAIQTAVAEYINTLGISGDVIRNRVIEVIMSVDGVRDVTLATPSANIIVLDNELPRTSAANIVLS